MAPFETCSFCYFPALGNCPKCHRLFCPDHAQENWPYLLCWECEQTHPDYLNTHGEFTQDQTTWYEHQTGLQCPLPDRRIGKKINSKVELWNFVEKIFSDNGYQLWEVCEQASIEGKNLRGAAICRLRNKGIFLPDSIFTAIDKEINDNELLSAMNLISDSLLVYPGQAQLRYAKAQVYGLQNQHQKAIVEYSDLIADYPEDTFAYSQRIQSQMRVKDKNYEVIREDIEYLRNKKAFYTGLYLISGMVYGRRVILFGEEEYASRAIDDLNKSIELAPAEAIPPKSIRGYINLILGNKKEAAKDLNEVKAVFGDTFDAVRALNFDY